MSNAAVLDPNQVDRNANPTVDPEWQMPFIGIGESVVLNGNVGGIVTAPGDKAISVIAYTKSGPRPYHSVKHKDDPNRGAQDMSPTWDYAPLRRAINAILKKMGMDDPCARPRAFKAPAPAPAPANPPAGQGQQQGNQPKGQQQGGNK